MEKFSKFFDYSAIDRNIGWRLETIRSRKKDAAILGAGKRPNHCPVCGNTEQDELIGIYGFNYVICSSCTLVYLNAIPDDEVLGAFYRQDSENLAKSPGDDLIHTDAFMQRVDAICTPKVEFVQSVLEKPVDRWVDLGCGVGDLVYAASQKGIDAKGFDIDPREIAHGQAMGSSVSCLEVNQSTAADVLADASVVSFISVLEHVPDCAALLSMAVSNADQDTSFVLEVPRFESVSSLVNMNFPDMISRHMLPPNHIMLFTETAFDNLLAKAGLERVATWYYGMDINELLGTLMLNVPSNRLNLEPLKSKLNEMQYILDEAKLCDEMLVVCRKV